jgi:hypothetical protein
MRNLIKILLLSTVLFSCKKDENNTEHKNVISSITKTSYEGILNYGTLVRGGFVEKEICIYDENGLIKDLTSNDFNNITCKTIYKYNKNNWITEKISNLSTGDNVSLIYSYTENNYIMKSYTNGILNYTIKGVIMDNGDILEFEKYDTKNNLLETTNNTYDGSGYLIEINMKLISNGNTIEYKSTFEYDQNGNVLKLYRYSNNKLAYTTSYEYKALDAMGNWTGCINTSTKPDETDYSISNREITYR